MRFLICLLVTLLMLGLVDGEAVLNGYPVTFSMTGTTSYTTDAGGGKTNGYVLTIGYMATSWLAVEFVMPGLNTDVLVMTIDDFYTDNGASISSGHQVTYKDYYRTSGGLIQDMNNNLDSSTSSYSNTKVFSLIINRPLTSNGGQDWPANTQAYSVLKVCFYTSNKTFDIGTYSQGFSSCYNYEINNYVSSFVGPFLKKFLFNGYNTSLYGYIDGPTLRSKVYIYQSVPLFAYVKIPAAVIEIGTTAGGYGQDFYASSPVSGQNGDYYGSDITNIKFDNLANGFQHPALTLKHWNAEPATQISGLQSTSLRISFSRDIYTYDSYDKQLQSTFIFCIYLYASGSISGSLSDKACEIVELSTVFVQMGMPVASNEYYMMPILFLIIFLLS